ncbi:MAG TPA: dihydrolipoamide acetyltransferase family protein [Steroidobacteraceae bacterium]|nr:dihydrolipoamide acetyltransferase family protein [Steroidobacteraceae bacterium]
MDVIMPQLGETVEEGTVAAWHKREGDKIAIDELLVEIETDKVATEVPSLVAGTVLKILVGAGETVKVGTILAIIDSGDGAGAAAPQAAGAPPASAKPPKAAAPAGSGIPAPTNRGGHGAPLSPAVRRLVSENDLDIALIQGTGRDGRVKRHDVLSYLQSHHTGRTKIRGTTEVVPFSAMRKRIAEHMVRSKAASAHVLQAVEVDFSAVEAARGALKKAWKEREGSSLTYLPFIVRAVVLALPEFPHLNAHVAGDSLTVYKAINLSLAVDLDGGGVVAPVIKNAAALPLPEIARAIARIAERARTNALKPDDMTEGTYSLTNNGSFGTFITAPIINQPQVAILSIDGVHRRPWVVTDDEGERIEIRPVGILAQSFDHRAVDGAYSGAYLRRVKQIIESRGWIGEISS